MDGTLFACAERELREETGLEARAEAVMPPVEVIRREHDEHHFLLVPVRMGAVRGTASAGDDATEVGWFEPHALPEPLNDDVATLVEASRPTGPPPKPQAVQRSSEGWGRAPWRRSV